MWLRSAVVLLLAVLVASSLAYDDGVQCGVCKGLVKEIRRGLKKTTGKQNLDLRGRLDPAGKRHGKVIDYSVSESRVLDILEGGDEGKGICSNLKDYAVTTQSDGSKQVIKVNNNEGEPVSISGSLSFGGDGGGGKQLQGKCESLLEEYEEEISESIRKTQPEELEYQVCGTVSDVCSADQLELAPTAPVESSKKEEV